MKINRQTAEHYLWKDICDGWHLLKTDGLSVIAEKMPPQTFEDMHCHERARQFFYILSGKAEMRFENSAEILEQGDGIEIEPFLFHQMSNPFDSPVEFMVISMPKAHGDKILFGKTPR